MIMHEKEALCIDPLLQVTMKYGAGGCINVIFDRTAVEGYSFDSPEPQGVKIFITEDVPLVTTPVTANPSDSSYHRLDGVYLQILSRSRHLPHFHLIISTLAAMQEPLSIPGLSALLYVSTYEVVRVLENLQAIIQLPSRDDYPVTLFHTSLRDFLVDESRSGDFYVPPSHHTFLTYRCLSLLFGPHPSSSEECCRYAIIWWATHWESALTMDPSFDYEELETPERWLDELHQPAGGVSQPEEFHLLDIEIFLDESDFLMFKANLCGAMALFHEMLNRWHEAMTSLNAEELNHREFFVSFIR